MRRRGEGRFTVVFTGPSFSSTSTHLCQSRLLPRKQGKDERSGQKIPFSPFFYTHVCMEKEKEEEEAFIHLPKTSFFLGCQLCMNIVFFDECGKKKFPPASPQTSSLASFSAALKKKSLIEDKHDFFTGKRRVAKWFFFLPFFSIQFFSHGRNLSHRVS